MNKKKSCIKVKKYHHLFLFTVLVTLLELKGLVLKLTLTQYYKQNLFK